MFSFVPESAKHSIANVYFAAGKSVAQIARIEDQHQESLPPKEYNAVAEEFAYFCTPVAEKLGLKTIFLPDRYDIANDLTPASLRALRFSNRMSTSHGSEREGFLVFIVHTHRSQSAARFKHAEALARAFDEKAESIVDSHDGTNQIQHPHWYKEASHEWESLIPMICANVSLLQSKPVIPVWKLPSCTTWH